MAKYCRERQHSPKRYDKRSFRTVRRGKRGIKQITACLKGSFKRGKCQKKKGKSALEVQSILYPEGSDKRCPRGAGGKELSKAARHKNPYLGRYDYVGHFPPRVVLAAEDLLKSYGLATYTYNDSGGVALYVPKGTGRRALTIIRENYE